MDRLTALHDYLKAWSAADGSRLPLARAVDAIAEASVAIARHVARGPFVATPCAAGALNADGDRQTGLDLWANETLIAALRDAPVAAVASEELDAPLEFGNSSPLVAAIDPLDGSSNIGANVAIGSIFSILPAIDGGPAASFLQPGRAQLAAGYVIYGPQCALALSLGEGVASFTFDPERGRFYLTDPAVRVAPASREFAINASNYRHWSPSIRAYIDDCVAGCEGPRGEDVNMRWIASLVAECHRILGRGGVFLYPRDAREGYENGRLRLVYEANPIAFIIEQGGGKAFDGETPILDIRPAALHQRTPLIFGSADEISRIARYKAEEAVSFERSPLFGRRGLLSV